jgi:hypothetical protein
MKNLITVKAPNKYKIYIIDVLERQKFITGKELVQLLKRDFSVKDVNARKIIQRSVNEGYIKSSSPLTFGNGQFVYLKINLTLTFESVMQICQTNRPPLYRLMYSMNLGNGVISYYEALKVSASPNEQLSSKIKTLDELIIELVKLDFVYEKTDENGVRYILEKYLQNNVGEEQNRISVHYNKLIMDCMFIPDILRWLKKCNIIDNNLLLYRNKKTPAIGAQQNGLIWDALAYTKTTGINEISGVKADVIEKQTFVPLDIILSRPYEQVDLDGFYNRIQLVLNSIKLGKRKVLPIVVYRTASDLILNKLAKLGFIAFDIGSIFGSKIYDVIEKINQIQINSNFSNLNVESAVSSILIKLQEAGQDNNLTDLKGTLFEFLMYPILKTIYPNAEIIHGKTYTNKNNDGTKEYYEYDYIVKSSNPHEILIVELKGYSSNAKIQVGDSNTKNTLKWFFRRTLLFAKKQFKKEIEEGAHFVGTFITSAGYFQDGYEFLEKLSTSSIKPKNLDIGYDGAQLLTLLEKYDFHKIKKTIERFYVKLD